MPDQKLLSFCLTGRNDSYLGNFKYRLKTAINYLASSCQRIEMLNQIEILITDWNSDIPLSEAIRLSPEASLITRFLYVPPSIAKKYHADINQKFNTVCATNAAIRRSSGKFICCMPADVLFPPLSLLNLIKVMSGDVDFPFETNKCLIKICRKMLPWRITESEPSLEDFERYLARTSAKIPYDRTSLPDLTHGLGATVASNEIWNLTQGFDERLTGWGFSDVEFGLRVEQVYPGIEVSHYGIYVYDTAENTNLSLTIKTKKQNHRIYHDTIRANSDSWGLNNERIEFRPPGELVSAGLNSEDKSIQSQEKSQSLTDIVKTMANRKFYNILKENLPFLKKLPIKWKIFYPIIWYGTTHSLDRYLEFGVHDTSFAYIASMTNPIVDITIALSLHGDINTRSKISPDDIAIYLSDVDHKGSCKYLTGNITTAVKRLKDYSADKCLFDLIIFQADLFGEAGPSLLSDVMNYLTEHGAVVVVGAPGGFFPYCWNETMMRHKSYIFIHCFDSEVGIILKSASVKNKIKISDTEIQRLLQKMWCPIIYRKSAYYVSLWLRLFSLGFERLIYQPIWRWPKLSFRLLIEFQKKRQNSFE